MQVIAFTDSAESLVNKRMRGDNVVGPLNITSAFPMLELSGRCGWWWKRFGCVKRMRAEHAGIGSDMCLFHSPLEHEASKSAFDAHETSHWAELFSGTCCVSDDVPEAWRRHAHCLGKSVDHISAASVQPPWCGAWWYQPAGSVAWERTSSHTTIARRNGNNQGSAWQPQQNQRFRGSARSRDEL